MVVRTLHPLRDRFVFEYGGLADDGMNQLQLAIRSEHPRFFGTIHRSEDFSDSDARRTASLDFVGMQLPYGLVHPLHRPTRRDRGMRDPASVRHSTVCIYSTGDARDE